MNRREIRAVAKLLGWSVTVQPNAFSPMYWTGYVWIEGKGAPIVMKGLHNSRGDAYRHSWTWISIQFIGEPYEPNSSIYT